MADSATHRSAILYISLYNIQITCPDITLVLFLVLTVTAVFQVNSLALNRHVLPLSLIPVAYNLQVQQVYPLEIVQSGAKSD